MTPAYYNEIDPYAAQWLRNLIRAGHIAPGDVDERSIRSVQPDDLKTYVQCHFFAGIGVWSHALRQAGWPDDQPVWTGSCPCQSFSAAGSRREFEDERHLWLVWFNLIRERQPDHIFGEQVASKDALPWFDLVSHDLENQGYAAGAVDMCASGFGAPHIRQRLFFVANTNKAGWGRGPKESKRTREGGRLAPAVRGNSFWRTAKRERGQDGIFRLVEPGTRPLVDGSPNDVGRLRAYGNAICAPVAEEFIRAYLSA